MPHPPPHHFVDDTHCMPTLLSDFGKIQKPHKNLRNTNLPLRLLAYTQPCWVIPGCLLALNVGLLLRTAHGTYSRQLSVLRKTLILYGLSEGTGEAHCDLGRAHTVFLATIALYQTPVNAECLEQPDGHQSSSMDRG